MASESCPRLTKEERYASQLRMIHPREGGVRKAIGAVLCGLGAYSVSRGLGPLSDLTIAAGVMLYNMGRSSQ